MSNPPCFSLLVPLVVLVLSSFVASPALAAPGKGCTSNPCSVTDVGPFLQDISANCYNVGNCTVGDMMQVFNNVGIFILGLVGSLVLLMYIIGGIMFLTAAGNDDRVKEGKKYLKNATIGLIIVFGAYAGIKTLDSILDRNQVTESAPTSTTTPGK